MKYNDLTLGTIEAVFNKLGGLEGAQRFLRGELVVKAAELLKQVATTVVGGVKRFVAKDHLAEANVVWTSDNFKQLFLEKTEENVEGITLTVHRLEKSSLDAPILAELSDRAETKLAHLFELLKRQSKGESGLLLTNGYANIAYVVGSDGNLWAVPAHWRGDGWFVLANSVENPLRWRDGFQVFSH